MTPDRSWRRGKCLELTELVLNSVITIAQHSAFTATAALQAMQLTYIAFQLFAAMALVSGVTLGVLKESEEQCFDGRFIHNHKAGCEEERSHANEEHRHEPKSSRVRLAKVDKAPGRNDSNNKDLAKEHDQPSDAMNRCYLDRIHSNDSKAPSGGLAKVVAVNRDHDVSMLVEKLDTSMIASETALTRDSASLGACALLTLQPRLHTCHNDTENLDESQQERAKSDRAQVKHNRAEKGTRDNAALELFARVGVVPVGDTSSDCGGLHSYDEIRRPKISQQEKDGHASHCVVKRVANVVTAVRLGSCAVLGHAGRK